MVNLIRTAWARENGFSGHGDWFEDSPQRREVLNAWIAGAQRIAPGTYWIESRTAAQVAKELN